MSDESSIEASDAVKDDQPKSSNEVSDDELMQ